MPEIRFWQGNTAVAMGAIAAGCRFFGGYPITPSSEIAEIMAVELPKVGGKFIQMEDEIGSIATVIGASIAGYKAMTATSGPGFSLKQENIGFAYMTEVPIVVVNVMRGGPSTGLPTKVSQQDVMQARWGTHGDHEAIALAPASVQECYELTIESFNLSERFRQPVILLSDEVVGHMREKVVIPERESISIVNRKKPRVKPEEYIPYKPDPEDDIPPMASFGDGYRWHVTGLTHDEWGSPTNDPDVTERKIRRLVRKVSRFKEEIVKYDTFETQDADMIVVAYGSVSRTALSAVREARSKGLKVGFFRPITLWPFPEDKLQVLLDGVKAVLVPELNCGQMVLEVQRAVEGRAKVFGKDLVNGDLFRPSEIFEFIKEVA